MNKAGWVIILIGTTLIVYTVFDQTSGADFINNMGYLTFAAGLLLWVAGSRATVESVEDPKKEE